MDRPHRTRTRPPATRPEPRTDQDRPYELPYAGSGETGSRRCPRCQAWIEAQYRDGDLVQVVVQHRWYPCRGRREPLPVQDWVVPLISRHTDSGTS